MAIHCNYAERVKFLIERIVAEYRRTQNSNRGNYPVILNVVILVQTFTIHIIK